MRSESGLGNLGTEKYEIPNEGQFCLRAIDNDKGFLEIKSLGILELIIVMFQIMNVI